MEKESFILALNNFTIIMNEIKQEFIIDSGTLLGYVRENGHIPHTSDIDTCTFKVTTDVEKEFRKRGWDVRHKFGCLGDGYEISFICPKTKIPIDLFELVYIPANNIHTKESWQSVSYTGLCNKMVGKRTFYKKYLSKKKKKINLYGIELFCTVDSDDYCLRQYGKNYMMP
jgi:phosphorylcholine metabolism protein LicD